MSADGPTKRLAAASQTTSTRSSWICATPSGSANGGDQRILRDRSAEVRRRTKVIGRSPGGTSCLSLVWAALDLFFTHASNGATFTDVDRQHLYRVKYPQADRDTVDEEVTAA